MKNIQNISVGYIILGNSVDVTDPCYAADVWCRAKIENMQPGKYACQTFIGDAGSWGRRVIKARIVLDDGSSVAQKTQQQIKSGESWCRLTSIGVDAGLAGFFANKPDFREEEWHELCGWMWSNESGDQDSFLKKMSNDTDGFWTRSGYGDGCYDVYVIQEKVGDAIRTTAAEIRFICL